MCLMLVLLLTIWGFHALFWIFYSPLCTWAAEQKRLSPVKSHIWAATFVEVSWFDLLLLPLSFSFFCCCFFFVVVVSTLKSMLGVMPVYSQWGLFNLSQRYTVYDISLLAVWKKEKKMTAAIWSHPDVYMDSIAPLILLFVFSSVTLPFCFQSPEEMMGFLLQSSCRSFILKNAEKLTLNTARFKAAVDRSVAEFVQNTEHWWCNDCDQFDHNHYITFFLQVESSC